VYEPTAGRFPSLSAMGLVLGRAFLLRQLFCKLGVQLGQLARLFEDCLLEFLVVQLGKGARLAVLVPLDDLPGNLRFCSVDRAHARG
jgi:hypothetical protein